MVFGRSSWAVGCGTAAVGVAIEAAGPGAPNTRAVLRFATAALWAYILLHAPPHDNGGSPPFGTASNAYECFAPLVEDVYRGQRPREYSPNPMSLPDGMRYAMTKKDTLAV
jgi:hypothetical protein